MHSVFEWLRRFDPAGYVPEAIVATLVGIGLPLAFILLRRAYRQWHFRQRDARTLAIRKLWPMILDGRVLPETWRFRRLDCEIVESMLLDRLEVAHPDEALLLCSCLRASGLLDLRIWEARHRRGWRRRQVLVALGRMRAEEAIPALAEALDDSQAETRIAALRGLGRTQMSAAAECILSCLAHGPLRFPETPLQNALLHCCREDPAVLIPYLHKADDRLRPLLARVLGEIATPALEEELLLLASDPLAEVRASAARALGEAKPRLALTALANLAGDREWFVRLRAVVAMGELHDARCIPVLIGTLCDANRHVRLRSAAALARLAGHVESIIEQVVKTRDRYALQALVSELERSGRILQLVNDLAEPRQRRTARASLLAAVRAGTHRLLLDTLMHHANWRVRTAIARLLAESGQPELVVPLERLEAGEQSLRQRRVIQWVLARLRDLGAPARADRVPA